MNLMNYIEEVKRHPDRIGSMQILSEKIFPSVSTEILFWNIFSTEAIHSIKPHQSKSTIFSLLKNDKSELVFAGQYDFIGLIKI